MDANLLLWIGQINVILGVIAALVAYGRFVVAPF